MSILRPSRLILGTLMANALISPAQAADDYGVISELNTQFEIKSPTLTELKGRKLLYMSSANGIYSARETKDGWTEPELSFKKPGYVVADPSIIKHPKSNEYFMFYTMRQTAPIERVVVDRRSGKKTTLRESPKNGIGVAYATSCDNSIDSSGLCWNDISKDKPLIGEWRGIPGGSAPSAFMSGTQVMLYYKANPPSGKITRSVVDLRDWKIEETKSVTFQSYDPIRKVWQVGGSHIQAGISDVDVKPYGKGYMMVGNDGSSNAISRWKSTNGINFYYDPYDGNSPIIHGGMREVKEPYLEPVTDNQFRVYYAFGDAKSACSQKRRAYGRTSTCNTAIHVRLMSEEKDPKIFENYYFDEDYKKPDYDSVQPEVDTYTQYKQDPEKYKIVLPKNAPKPPAYKINPEAVKQKKE